MRIIVSGAGGFLGKKVLEEAVRANIDVMAITSNPDCLQFEDDRILYFPTDYFMDNGLPMTHEDIFINCLFPTYANGYRMSDGLRKTFACMEVAKQCGVGGFINISSQSVYSSMKIKPATEEDPVCPDSAYAVGKYASELFCNSVFNGVPHTNIRLSSLISPNSDRRLINRLIDHALKKGSLIISGGTQRYSFLDVRDAAAGLISISVSDKKKWRKTYNLGRNESTTLYDLSELIKEHLCRRGIDISIELTPGGDIRNFSMDANLFMNDFGWEPTISLEKTIESIIDEKWNEITEDKIHENLGYREGISYT